MIYVNGESVVIYTGRIGCGDPNALDITIKGVTDAERKRLPLPLGAILAPTWKLVKGHKAGRITDEQYTTAYKALLRKRYAANPQAFYDLLRDREYIILMCYCPAGAFCHRHIAREVLIACGARALASYVDGGEVGEH